MYAVRIVLVLVSYVEGTQKDVVFVLGFCDIDVIYFVVSQAKPRY